MRCSASACQHTIESSRLVSLSLIHITLTHIYIFPFKITVNWLIFFFLLVGFSSECMRVEIYNGEKSNRASDWFVSGCYLIISIERKRSKNVNKNNYIIFNQAIENGKRLDFLQNLYAAIILNWDFHCFNVLSSYLFRRFCK